MYENIFVVYHQSQYQLTQGTNKMPIGISDIKNSKEAGVPLLEQRTKSLLLYFVTPHVSSEFEQKIEAAERCTANYQATCNLNLQQV